MARQKTIHTAEDGTLYYALRRARTIEVPGTKGLRVEESANVPQLPTEGSLEEILQSALNVVEGRNEAEKIANLAEIVNAGLIKTAEATIQANLNKRINENKVVSDFANIVTATKSFFPNVSDAERAQTIIDSMPQVAAMLADAGLEIVVDDTSDDDETDD